MNSKPEPSKDDLRSLAFLLNECWSELNENRVPEAKSDLCKAMKFLHHLRGNPMPEDPPFTKRRNGVNKRK